MFQVLEEEKAKYLKGEGNLALKYKYFEACELQLPPPGPEHSICYYQKKNIKKSYKELFNCEIRLTENIFIMEKLTTASRLLEQDEGFLYFYLRWVFEKAEFWARHVGKKLVRVETMLPHSTEMFVDLGYKILQTDRTHRPEVGGVKRLL